MTGLAGADPDDLDSLAIAFEGFSRRLHDSCSSISGSVHHNPWRGQRADHFRHEWDRHFWPMVNSIITALDDVTKLLHDNANQQRQASGEAVKDYSRGSFFGNLFKQAEKAIDEAGHAVREVVASKEFAQVLGGLQVVSTVTGMLSLIPGLQGLAVVSVAASAVVLLGHAAQMANSGDWNYAKLAEDGLAVGLGAASGGALGRTVEKAAELNLVRHGGEAFSSLTNAEKALTVVRAVHLGVHEGNTTYNVVTDVAHGEFGQAAVEAMGYAAPLKLGRLDDQHLADGLEGLKTEVDAVNSAPAGAQAILEELGK
jgi:hypothetical protein